MAAPIERVYDAHHGWLLSWLRFRLGNDGDAADLAHDVFLRLIFRPPARDFANDGQARSYLSKMAGGMCINLWRRREIEQAWLDTLAAQPDTCAPSEEAKAVVLETLQELGAAMSHLSGRGPEVFLYALVCGMTDREISVELGISTRMVRKYIVRATLACLQFKARHQQEHGASWS